MIANAAVYSCGFLSGLSYKEIALFDQTVEIFIGIGDVTSTNGPGKCASTKTLNKYKILMFVVYMLTGV